MALNVHALHPSRNYSKHLSSVLRDVMLTGNAEVTAAGLQGHLAMDTPGAVIADRQL
jgi:hypothetical protein